YLSSPINVFLAYDMLRCLTHFRGGICDKTRIAIRTCFAGNPKTPEFWRNSWRDSTVQEQVLRALMESISPNCSLDIENTWNVQHHRELVLKWTDGATWAMQLDHGLSFLRPDKKTPFHFALRPELQAEKIAAADLRLRSSHQIPFVFYVQPQVIAH
ncbi:MAG: hypothetical protein VX223_12110, partial [Myxococcota bacterium]|nr:hypothetical protein [Myxococcota bacterium]